MLKLTIIVVVIGIIEDLYRPRLEKGRGGLILWYGKGTKRKYIKL